MLMLSNANASVIQGLIAQKGLKAKGFFRNLRMRTRKKKNNKNERVEISFISIVFSLIRILPNLSSLKVVSLSIP